MQIEYTRRLPSTASWAWIQSQALLMGLCMMGEDGGGGGILTLR